MIRNIYYLQNNIMKKKKKTTRHDKTQKSIENIKINNRQSEIGDRGAAKYHTVFSGYNRSVYDEMA